MDLDRPSRNNLPLAILWHCTKLRGQIPSSTPHEVATKFWTKSTFNKCPQKHLTTPTVMTKCIENPRAKSLFSIPHGPTCRDQSMNQVYFDRSPLLERAHDTPCRDDMYGVTKASFIHRRPHDNLCCDLRYGRRRLDISSSRHQMSRPNKPLTRLDRSPALHFITS